MSFCAFADGAAMFDATPIENLFLMEYMYDAPAPALKVYLYARMLALHPELGGTMADLSKALHISEEDVYDAFTYWENRGLVRRLTDQPPTYAFQPMRSAAPAASTLLDREMYANRDFNNRLRQLFGDEFIGQHELRKAEEWQDILKFDQDAILRMVEYGIQTSRTMNAKTPKLPKPPSVFKRMDKLAEEWSKKGIRTLEDVEKAIDQETVLQTARAVLKKLGIYREPSEPEMEYFRRWTEEWHYTEAQLLDACNETISARNPTVKYLDTILESRQGSDPKYFRLAAEALRELNPNMVHPSPDQVEQYRALVDEGYSHEMIKLAAVQCHRRNKHTFDDMKWRLNLWRSEGIDTPEDAESYMRQMGTLARELREIYIRAGSDDRTPGYNDIKRYQGWKEIYPRDMILFAAECARSKGGSMAYMDTLLTRWAKDGATNVEQARALREAWRQSGGNPPGSDAGRPANPALDYAQREYKDEDFGDDFLVDLDKYGEEDKR